MEIQQFQLIRNSLQSDDIQMMKSLVRLKCLYSKQLSRMPRQYLVKLLFDTYHESLILKIEGIILAGLTFRGFKEKHFLQIAFLAVNNQNQCQGLGSNIMNRFKKHCQDKNITHVFTFADDGALGFFQKHGFSQKVTVPDQQYKRCIKQYIGGKIMQCKIHKSIDYQNFRQGLQHSRNFIIQRVRELTVCQTQYDIRRSSKIIKEKVSSFKFTQDLTEFIPGLPEAGFIKDGKQGQKKKLKLSFLLYCQNFIQMVSRKGTLLCGEDSQQVEIIISPVQGDKQNKNMSKFSKLLNLLKDLQLSLFQGCFEYKDQFIQQFTDKLKQILIHEDRNKKKCRQFLQKIEILKYQFMKNLLQFQLKQRKGKPPT